MNGITHIAQTLAGAPWNLSPRRAELVGQDGQAATSKTERMRQYLRTQGPANSHTLAMEADVPSCGLVAALLKNDLHKGSVFKRGNHYHWNPQWDEQIQAQIQQAKTLLRRHGYAVQRLT